MNRTLFVSAGIAAVLVIVLLVVLSTSGGGGDVTREETLDRSTTDPTEGYIVEDGQVVDLTETRVTYEQVIEDYERWSRYPPNSRPLKISHTDQIEHHWIQLPESPMPVPDGEGGLKDPTFQCRLQPLNHTVTEAQTMRVSLRCAVIQREDAGPQGAPGTPLEIREVRLIRFVGDNTFRTPQPEIQPGTAENDYTYRLDYRPRRDDWGDMQIEADFVIPAEKSGFTHTLKGHFFSSPTAPAEFSAISGERLENGSLVITAQLNVRLPGRYTIEANLFNADGPVAYARTDERFGGGPQQVELTFFGKIFHDEQAEGPYTLRGLRGIQDTDPVELEMLTRSVEEVEAYLKTVRSDTPHRRVIPGFEEEYETRPYVLNDFASAPWDAPEKQERLAELRELAAGE